MDKYSFNIVWSEEDGEFVCTCPSFPFLSALGGTQEEALRAGQGAVARMVAACLAAGEEVPGPFVITGYEGRERPVRRPYTG